MLTDITPIEKMEAILYDVSIFINGSCFISGLMIASFIYFSYSIISMGFLTAAGISLVFCLVSLWLRQKRYGKRHHDMALRVTKMEQLITFAVFGEEI